SDKGVEIKLDQKDKKLHITPEGQQGGGWEQHQIHVARSKNYGVIFTFVLILVILVTNVPLRGMWSLMIIVTIIFLTILFAALDWWNRILETIDLLQIYINAGGYLAIAVGLLVVWLVTFIFFDPQVYMVFTPGQVKINV